MEIKDKIVWITGASSGIGEELAVAFADAGARLILSARRPEELDRVAARCNVERSMVTAVPLDITDGQAIESAAAATLAQFGHIDILVNNAGITHRSLVENTDMAVYRKMMETNFFGPVALTQAVLPSMLERRSGHVVIIGSPAGIFGTSIRSGYSATKFAVHGFFECLRAEVRDRGIDVSVVIPGPIRTNFSINSLTGDGGRHGVMDKFMDEGIDPSVCAQKILNGLKRKKKEIYIVNGEVRRAILTRRFFPERFFMKAAQLAPK
jgi:short-subunit dehydrogenase